MNDIKYKLLDAKDVALYKKELINILKMILHENITQSFNKYLPEKYIDQLPKYINDKSALIIGAFDKDSLIGFHWCYYLNVFDEKRLHSYFVGILPHYRGLKIAYRMFQIIENIAKKDGVFVIEAMVTYENKQAYRYHENQGFKIERVKMKKVIK
ncbi:MAG: GNAT family N-acetyltransferase [Beduini sp.]|uniref:GNAT family N-acetyltransferase n=1 Tax=Beduini sp. TaxID=1922300 RepID=UPI0011C9FC6F